MTTQCLVKTRIPVQVLDQKGTAYLHFYKMGEQEHYALVFGNLTSKSLMDPTASTWEKTIKGMEHPTSLQNTFSQSDSTGPLIRLHSACFTGETLGSVRCDCKQQLDTALSLMIKANHGKQRLDRFRNFSLFKPRRSRNWTI